MDGRDGNGGSMSAESNDLNLKGCAPVPLAHYLKALGIFRIVAEQVDPGAKGYWIGDSFRLKTTMDSESLRTFFLEKYSPTPIVAPWNGGSGFYFQEEKLKEKDPLTGKKKKTGRRTQQTAATKAVQDILESTADETFSLSQVSPDHQEPGQKDGTGRSSLQRGKRGAYPGSAKQSS